MAIGFSAKQIFWGNILLVVCCTFYLAWWLLAFNPAGAVKGMKTGWLLIPATAAGIAAIILAVKGMTAASTGVTLFPGGSLLWGAAAVYLILLAATRLFLKRPVTTELFLIVGWAALALSEIDTLYGTGLLSRGTAVLFIAVIGLTFLISLICYLLYYNLKDSAGYFDGIIPLIMTALVMAAISASIAVKG